MLIQIIDFLAKNSISVVVLALTGIALTVYGIIDSRKASSSLRYTMRTIPIFTEIANRLPELQLRYAGYGKPIENVSVTKLLLWNGGRVAIRTSDIASADPITIQAKEDTVILETRLLASENGASGFGVRLDKKGRQRASINFEFMNFRQSNLLMIVHTGKLEDDIFLTGQIIGVGQLKRIPFQRFASEGAVRRNRITTYAARSAARLGGLVYGRAIGLFFIFLAFGTTMFSIEKIIAYHRTMPPVDAQGTSAIEFIIYGPFIYLWSMTGYFILNRMPPRFYEEFERNL